MVGILSHDILHNSRKGVSPFIASVILILITIVVGSFLASWSHDLAKDQADAVTTNTKPECNYVFLNVQNLQYDNTTAKQLSMLIQNTGTADTKIMGVQLFYDNFTEESLPDIFPVDLEAGHMQPFRFNASENIKYVQIISSCQDKSIKLYGSDINII
ncbi:MAG: hypothetical protein KAJ20_00165 [Candidatus Aenigmarchaeota archaeon]|nr:hypothetical protein [Candidatus Aenigmarchaeota archaeon]MCK5234679.1 hypothetical protein [Candidatus Aenigmarchaeota archaeon]MCK5372732.1 hypothetical protein [Candidatus Aenigmarchaeota archaeon]